MTVLNILTAPDPRLRTKAEKVEDVQSIQRLIDDMLETLYATSNGIGLAATQVGRRESVVIIDLSHNPLVLINPEIRVITQSITKKGACLYLNITLILSVTHLLITSYR